MKRLALLLLSIVLIGVLSFTAQAQADDAVYELRVYTCEPGKLDALHTRFREHTLAIFAKHGMESVAYWSPVDEPLSENTLVYLLRHKSREEAQASWDAFRNDPAWKAVAKSSQEEHGKILAKAPESTFLVATDYSPKIRPADRGSLFELRTYTADVGKLEDLHARFRDHTHKLFQKHGMHPYGYWKPLDEPLAGNTMIYMIEHPDRELARAAWQAFAADPDWHAARDASETEGRLVIKGGVKSVYLKPTDYSPTNGSANPD